MTEGGLVGEGMWAFSEFCEGTFGRGRAWSAGETLGRTTDSRQAFAYSALYHLESRLPPLQRQCLLPRPLRAWAASWCRVIQRNCDWCELVQTSRWGAEIIPLLLHYHSIIPTLPVIPQHQVFTILSLHNPVCSHSQSTVVAHLVSLHFFFILHHLQEKLE